MRHLIFILIISFSSQLWAQEKPDSVKQLSFLFVGDIMGHDSQINSAYNEASKTWNYADGLVHLKPLFEKVDFAIANLEVTLAGPPYKGYPQFSSPDQLAIDFKQAGIDIFATANNHSCDRRKKGIIRTIDVLDSIKVKRVGTYKDSADHAANHPLIIEKKGIKVALLNYTYGTNGIPVPKPTIVNLIDQSTIVRDIKKAQSMHADQIIIFMHWGLEYQSEPNKQQIELAEYCIAKGADIIIGSHPHVIQKAVWQKQNTNDKDTLIAYSLGNFVSNQRKPRTDGGMMFEFTLKKENKTTKVVDAGYYLTWVNKTTKSGKTKFEILPCSNFEDKAEYFDSEVMYNKMKTFVADSRKLMNSQNRNVEEKTYKSE